MAQTSKINLSSEGAILKFAFVAEESQRSGAGLLKVSVNRAGASKLDVVVSAVRELFESDVSQSWFDFVTPLREHELIEAEAVIQTNKLKNELAIDLADESGSLRSLILSRDGKKTEAFLLEAIAGALGERSLSIKLAFEDVVVVKLAL